tara:strand:+ start:963 stop:1193 length:231 start_codon:yes stop_codon:yes gene_type:complete
MDIAKAALDRAKFNIEKELEYCDKMDTPYICALSETTQGKAQVVASILEMVGYRGFTISMAIAEQENLLNPHYTSN